MLRYNLDAATQKLDVVTHKLETLAHKLPRRNARRTRNHRRLAAFVIGSVAAAGMAVGGLFVNRQLAERRSARGRVRRAMKQVDRVRPVVRRFVR